MTRDGYGMTIRRPAVVSFCNKVCSDYFYSLSSDEVQGAFSVKDRDATLTPFVVSALLT